MRKIIVDCDPGMDDSSAIIMAVKNPNLDIQAVTTVNGNYPVDITYRNARRIMRMLGREDIPVYRGCSRPLVRDIPNDPFTHGRDGQGEAAKAGFVGLITANSFMKREFGAKLIEQVLPALDLTHVNDTSGATRTTNSIGTKRPRFSSILA